ncbi:hypothetical protein ScPMuIL_012718 [Solemya velum]
MVKLNTFLSANDVDDLKKTGWTEKDLLKVLKRYADFDKGEKEVKGLEYKTVVNMPEFVGTPFVGILTNHLLEPKTQRLYPKNFIKLCHTLSSRISVKEKRDFLFQGLDGYKTGILTHDEMFYLYKILYHSVMSDDHILALTFKALKHPKLKQQGEITKQEFDQMIPDHEIMDKMTIQFQYL